jgi:SAM-dependent methyltransferase
MSWFDTLHPDTKDFLHSNHYKSEDSLRFFTREDCGKINKHDCEEIIKKAKENRESWISRVTDLQKHQILNNGFIDGDEPQVSFEDLREVYNDYMRSSKKVNLYSDAPTVNMSEEKYELYKHILNPPLISEQKEKELLEFSKTGPILLLGCTSTTPRIGDLRHVVTIDIDEKDQSVNHINGDFNITEGDTSPFNHFSSEQFNSIVFDHDVIKYVTNPLVFQKLYDLLKPGGTLYLTLNIARSFATLLYITTHRGTRYIEPIFYQDSHLFEYYDYIKRLFIPQGVRTFPLEGAFQHGGFVCVKESVAPMGKKSQLKRRLKKLKRFTRGKRKSTRVKSQLKK